MPDAGRTHGPPATKKAGGSHHRSSRNKTGIPCAMVLTAASRSPWSAGLDSLHRQQVRRLLTYLSVGVFGQSFLTDEPKRLMQGFIDRKR